MQLPSQASLSSHYSLPFFNSMALNVDVNNLDLPLIRIEELSHLYDYQQHVQQLQNHQQDNFSPAVSNDKVSLIDDTSSDDTTDDVSKSYDIQLSTCNSLMLPCSDTDIVNHAKRSNTTSLSSLRIVSQKSSTPSSTVKTSPIQSSSFKKKKKKKPSNSKRVRFELELGNNSTQLTGQNTKNMFENDQLDFSDAGEKIFLPEQNKTIKLEQNCLQLDNEFTTNYIETENIQTSITENEQNGESNNSSIDSINNNSTFFKEHQKKINEAIEIHDNSSNSSSEKSTQNSSNTVKSHTRKCREKVSRNLDYLSSVLQIEDNNTKLKNKAKLLEYAIHTIRELVNKKNSFEAGIAFSSSQSLQSWSNNKINDFTKNRSAVTKSLRQCSSFTLLTNSTAEFELYELLIGDVFNSFLNIYVPYFNWNYGEIWIREKKNENVRLVSSVIHSNDESAKNNLKEFYDQSRTKCSPYTFKTGIISRVMATRKPEWISNFCNIDSNMNKFDRYNLTRDHGLQVLLAIPLSLTPDTCDGVIILGHLSARSYEESTIRTLQKHVTLILEQCEHQS